MILTDSLISDVENACPHTRGDDPFITKKFICQGFLSPYAWG